VVGIITQAKGKKSQNQSATKKCPLMTCPANINSSSIQIMIASGSRPFSTRLLLIESSRTFISHCTLRHSTLCFSHTTSYLADNSYIKIAFYIYSACTCS
jgi:hypothetical protein